MPLVIYGLGAYTHTYTHMHTLVDESDYKKPGACLTVDIIHSIHLDTKKSFMGGG